jgi:hypothetical protein
MNFEELSQNWQTQDNVEDYISADQIKSQAQNLTQHFKLKKLWTIGILSLTFIILISFFISVGAYNNWTESLGLILMIGMLLIRVILELISKQQLQQIDQALNFQSYIEKHKRYFKNRQWIHFVFTPIIYLAYFGGFLAMLPVFKAELSEGFYLYILISGVAVFIVLALFIGFHIRKELLALKFLNATLKE